MTDQLALAQIDTIRATLATAATIPENMVAAIGENLRLLWNSAEADGDEKIMTAISETWDMAQSHLATTQAVAAAAISATELAHNLMEARDQIAQEYADLESAVETADRRNILVDDLIGEIEEEVSEQVFDQAMDYAFDTLHDEIVSQIEEATGQTWRQVSQFYSALRNGDITQDEMLAMRSLIEIVSTRVEAEFQRRMHPRAS
jgi:hypothetical protein